MIIWDVPPALRCSQDRIQDKGRGNARTHLNHPDQRTPPWRRVMLARDERKARKAESEPSAYRHLGRAKGSAPLEPKDHPGKVVAMSGRRRRRERLEDNGHDVGAPEGAEH